MRVASVRWTLSGWLIHVWWIVSGWLQPDGWYPGGFCPVNLIRVASVWGTWCIREVGVSTFIAYLYMIVLGSFLVSEVRNTVSNPEGLSNKGEWIYHTISISKAYTCWLAMGATFKAMPSGNRLILGWSTCPRGVQTYAVARIRPVNICHITHNIYIIQNIWHTKHMSTRLLQTTRRLHNVVYIHWLTVASQCRVIDVTGHQLLNCCPARQQFSNWCPVTSGSMDQHYNESYHVTRYWPMTTQQIDEVCYKYNCLM